MQTKTTQTYAAFTLTKFTVNGIEFMLISYTDENHTPPFKSKCPVFYFGVQGRYCIKSCGLPYTCAKGEALVIYDANNLPVEKAEAGVVVFAFQLTEVWCQRLAITMPTLQSRKMQQGDEVYSFIADLHREFMHTNTLCTKTVQILLLQLVKTLEATNAGTTTDSTGWAAKLHLVLPSLPLEKINLTHLARLCGVNEVTVSRCFKKEFGVSLSNYKINRQMETALQLFEERKHTYLEISDLCCFSNYANFSKVFKKKMNKTPYEYWLEKNPC